MIWPGLVFYQIPIYYEEIKETVWSLKVTHNLYVVINIEAFTFVTYTMCVLE